MLIALRARTQDAGLHKRMVLIAVTAVLGAAICPHPLATVDHAEQPDDSGPFFKRLLLLPCSSGI